MNTKKQTIINKSVELFNKEGVAHVTVRRICDAVCMSPGNFTYHFKNMNVLIQAIHEQMVASMDPFYQSTNKALFESLQNILQNAYQLQMNYAFFFLESGYIEHKYREVAKKHQQLMQKRFKQVNKIVGQLVKANILKQSSNGFSYEALMQSIWLLFPAAIKAEMNNTIVKNHQLAVSLAWNMLLPQLTAKGLRAYQKIYKK